MSHSALKQKFSALFGFTLILALGMGAGTSAKSVAKADFSKQVYRLQSGDQIEIIVWGYSNLSRKTKVREDGTFSFPMGGNILAAGHSLREIEEEIQARLSRPGAPSEAPPMRDFPELAAGAARNLSEEKPKGSQHPKTSRVVSAAEVASDTYRLRPGDQLDISVWGQDDLDQKVQVSEDGTFSFPLIGSVNAAGRSLGEVVKEIQERLDRDYIVSPYVTARLIEAKFSILGEAAQPGSYPIEGAVDLLTAISQAGGTTENASSDIEIIRERGKQEKIAIQANLERILKGQDPVIDIFPRDTLYVKGSPAESSEVSIKLIEAKFSVLGEVKRPGTYPLEGTVDLLTAMSLAGGINQFGSSTVELIRQEADTRTRVRVNLDRILVGKDPNFEIFPHDVIYVRRRLF